MPEETSTYQVFAQAGFEIAISVLEELTRAEREPYFRQMSKKFHADAIELGATPRQADVVTDAFFEAVRETISRIEMSGGAQGGNA